MGNLAGTNAERCGTVGALGRPVNAPRARPDRPARRAALGLAVALSLLGLGPPAVGKIPSGRRVLGRSARAKVTARPLVLSLQGDVHPLAGAARAGGSGVVASGASAPSAPHAPPGTGSPAAAAPTPWLLRWILGPDGRARVDRVRLSPSQAQAAFLAPGEVPPWLRLLAGDAPAEVAADTGVDVSRTSLDHDGGTILVVVGAGPRDRTSPQLHLERASGRLRRVIWRNGAGVTHDVRLSGELVADGAPTGWPARVVERADGEEGRWEVTSVHEGVILEPGQLTPPPAPGVGPADPGQPAGARSPASLPDAAPAPGGPPRPRPPAPTPSVPAPDPAPVP